MFKEGWWDRCGGSVDTVLEEGAKGPGPEVGFGKESVTRGFCQMRLVFGEPIDGDCLKIGKAIEEPFDDVLVFFGAVGASHVEQVALRGDEGGGVSEDALLAVGIFVDVDGVKTARRFAALCQERLTAARGIDEDDGGGAGDDLGQDLRVGAEDGGGGEAAALEVGT